MIIFDADLVEQSLEPYLGEIRQIAMESFKDYQSIRTSQNVDYDAWTRAFIIRGHIKDKLEKASFVDGTKNKIVNKNNTFFLYIDKFPITFHKLNKDKTKCKYIDDLKMNISSNIKQLTLLVNSTIIGKQYICEQIPLTFGYILNPIGTEIHGFYLTYQIGKEVKWYKRVDFDEPMAITSNDNPPPSKNQRVIIK